MSKQCIMGVLISRREGKIAITAHSLAMSGVLCLVMWCTHHVTGHNTPIYNILSTTPQLSISQKALGKLPEDGNVMPKHVGATIRN
jgi:hypothetical protein